MSRDPRDARSEQDLSGDATNPGQLPDQTQPGLVPRHVAKVIAAAELAPELTDLISRSRVPPELRGADAATDQTEPGREPPRLPPDALFGEPHQLLRPPELAEQTRPGSGGPSLSAEALFDLGSDGAGTGEQTQPAARRPRPTVEELPGPGMDMADAEALPSVVLRTTATREDIPLPPPDPTLVTGRPRPPPPVLQPDLASDADAPFSEPDPEIADEPTPVPAVPVRTPTARFSIPTTRGAVRDRVLTWLAVAWGLVLFAAFHPGLPAPQSADALAQGLARSYSNLQPPLATILLAELTRLAGTPAVVLALQLALLAGGLASLAHSARGGTWASVVWVGACLLLPAVWALAPVVWADMWFADALLWTVVLLDRQRRWPALAAMIAAALLRYEAIPALFPLVALWTAQLFPRGRWFARVPVTCLILALLGALPFAIQQLVGAHRAWPFGRAMAWDVVGIAVERPETYANTVLSEQLSPGRLAAVYTPQGANPLFDAGAGALDPQRLSSERFRLQAEWARAIRSAPKAWWDHRWRVARGVLGIGGPVSAPGWEAGPSAWGEPQSTPGVLLRDLNPLRLSLRNGLLLRGVWWLGAALGCALAGAFLRRRSRLVWRLGVSALLYAGWVMLTTAAVDVRALTWVVVAMAAAGTLLTRRVVKRGPAPRLQ